MAGTASDHTTSDDWWWFRDEVAFVAERVHSGEAAALEYILDRLHRGEIDWCYDKLEMHFRGASAPESDWVRIGQLFFWRRYVFVEPHKVDLVNNSATRTGAAILKIGDDDKGNPQPIYNGRFLLEMRATLIRLHHPTVVRCLQRNKYVPPSLSLTPAVQSGESSARQEPEQARPSAPAQSSTASQKLARLADEPQLEPEQRRKWRPEEVDRWLADQLKQDPLLPGQNKNAWARKHYANMEEDFDPPLPWAKATLRRRLNDLEFRESDKTRQKS